MKSRPAAHFDQYAEDYDAVLEEALSVSGEDKQYFLRGRISWLANCLRRLRERPKSVLDYGCGTGAASSLFRELMGAESVAGVDVSLKSLDLARRMFSSDRTRFYAADEYKPRGEMDLVYSNGVFHHIHPGERAAALDYIRRSLCPGGLFALWENNPWNPGTRYVMARCRFDDDAINLSHLETRRMIHAGGFRILRTDFLFIFPRKLRWFRGMETFLSRLPLGAQYQVLCRKPSNGRT